MALFYDLYLKWRSYFLAYRVEALFVESSNLNSHAEAQFYSKPFIPSITSFLNGLVH